MTILNKLECFEVTLRGGDTDRKKKHLVFNAYR